MLAGGCSNLGGILAEQDRFADAEPLLRQGIKLNPDLREFPDDRELDFDLANCDHNLGYLCSSEAMPKKPWPPRRGGKAVAIAGQAAPPLPRCKRNLALILRWRGDALEALERSGVEKAYREAVAILEKLTADFRPMSFTSSIWLAA